MKKRLIFCGILTLALSLNVACGKKAKVEDNVEENNLLEDRLVDNESNQEIIKIQSDKIDFFKVKYKISEMERDENLEKLIVDYLEYDPNIDGKLVYFYNKVDLNSDDKEEIFVYLMGDSVSGSGGTTALIIDDSKSKVISRFTLVRNPIVISQDKTNNWNDIIMEVSGGGAESGYARIVFDGKKYPSNPSVEPMLEEGTSVEGIGIISNFTGLDEGISINK